MAVFPEHALAHQMLDGLTGLEIGPAAHNPFGLRTRNVAPPEGHELYEQYQREVLGVEPTPIDIWAFADRLPLPDQSEDFILSSHLVEHLPNVIGTFVEWNRVVKDGGYVFMIVPKRDALIHDVPRDLTPLGHFVGDYRLDLTVDTHPVEGVPGGRMSHYHTFTPDSLIEIVEWMQNERLCDWTLSAREDTDTKVGNGFTLVYQVNRPGGPQAARFRPAPRRVAKPDTLQTIAALLSQGPRPARSHPLLLARIAAKALKIVATRGVPGLRLEIAAEAQRVATASQHKDSRAP